MIEKIRNKHKDKTIAVLGSSPTLRLYRGKEDIAIACNGACQTPEKYDYFLYIDHRAPSRDWFSKSSEEITRIAASYITPCDKYLYPSIDERIQIAEELYEFIKIKTQGKNRINIDMGDFEPTIEPKKPHIYIKTIHVVGEILKGLKDLKEEDYTTDMPVYRGGTVTGSAVCLAMIMGAKEIHLYGCSFDNNSGTNYAFGCKKGEEGDTSDKQREIMDVIINIILKKGVNVYVHGHTTLKNPIRVD